MSAPLTMKKNGGEVHALSLALGGYVLTRTTRMLHDSQSGSEGGITASHLDLFLRDKSRSVLSPGALLKPIS